MVSRVLRVIKRTRRYMAYRGRHRALGVAVAGLGLIVMWIAPASWLTLLGYIAVCWILVIVVYR
jgi:hypothetical protein